MSTRHLAMVVPGLGHTGGFRTLIEWANRLSSDVARLTVVSPTDGPGRQLLGPRVHVRRAKPQRAWDVVRGIATSHFGERGQLFTSPLLCAPLLPRDAEVINCYAPFRGRLLGRTPALTYMQHWEPVWYPCDARARAAAERGMREVSEGVVNSTWLLGKFAEARREHMSLVFPGVDTSTFRPDGTAPPASTSRPLRIVALGREEPFKGLADLRAAAAHLDVPVCLHLFGTPDRRTVHHTVMEEHHGRLTQSELAQLYRSADVVVTPSWYESFPLPPLEAMASGSLVVTSRQGTEDYAVDGYNSFVFDGGDVRGLLIALQRALSSQRAVISAAARATSERFTWDHGYAMLRTALISRDLLDP